MKSVVVAALLVFGSFEAAQATDWIRFRGPNGQGIAESTAPVEWSDTQNLKWKAELPGPGSASPIVLGNRVFVVCYSGYGVDSQDPGDLANLKRHILCIDRKTGKTLWQKTLTAEMPEDAYRGFIAEHGYASNTPTTDGERLYVFLGKSGVFAFDLDGKELWHVEVGKETSSREWGSAASLVVVGDALIVNASEESQSIIALNKLTGEQLWKQEAASLEQSYGTPTVVGDRDDLVLAVPSEVWAINPKNGKLRWFATTSIGGNVSPSVLYRDGIVYAFGGIRGAGSIAIRTGGKGDVTDKNVVWSSRNSSYVASPVLHEGHFYWIDDRGVANCTKAADGETIYRERVTPTAGGDLGGRSFYASPVLAGDKLYCVSRHAGTFVLPAKPEFKQLAVNRFAGDDTDFNGTPAIVDGQIFLRSNKALYCIAE